MAFSDTTISCRILSRVPVCDIILLTVFGCGDVLVISLADQMGCVDLLPVELVELYDSMYTTYTCMILFSVTASAMIPVHSTGTAAVGRYNSMFRALVFSGISEDGVAVVVLAQVWEPERVL